MRTFKPFETSPFWELKDPDKEGYVHRGRTRAELVSNITNFRAQNQLPSIERLDLVIDDYLCSKKENQHKCRQLEIRRGILEYLKGGISLVKVLALGPKEIVSQEIADSRSELCKDCVYNVYPDHDKFIAWSDEIAWHTVGDRRTKHHDALANCVACSCCLKAKCWVKGPFELSDKEKETMRTAKSSVTGQPIKCWQL